MPSNPSKACGPCFGTLKIGCLGRDAINSTNHNTLSFRTTGYKRNVKNNLIYSFAAQMHKLHRQKLWMEEIETKETAFKNGALLIRIWKAYAQNAAIARKISLSPSSQSVRLCRMPYLVKREKKRLSSHILIFSSSSFA